MLSNANLSFRYVFGCSGSFSFQYCRESVALFRSISLAFFNVGFRMSILSVFPCTFSPFERMAEHHDTYNGYYT